MVKNENVILFLPIMSKSRRFCQTRSLIPMVKNENLISFRPIMSKSRCFCQTRYLIPMAKNQDLISLLPKRKQAKLEDSPDPSLDPTSPKQDFSYLAYYAYAEVPPDKKPADTVLESFRGIPVGTPVEEIKRVSDAFGLDFVFMRAVAKIESDLNPKQRTGSYIGLFQLSKHEFEKYGSGNITDPRDNAVAAACKLSVETKLFELDTHKKATLNDIYLVHQQGLQGAAEHVNHPERIAWKSMCATDEGKERGEKWCKLAIWGNTLPTIKHVWKSVTKLTSGAFVTMWQQRVDHFYARYSEATAEKKDR